MCAWAIILLMSSIEIASGQNNAGENGIYRLLSEEKITRYCVFYSSTSKERERLSKVIKRIKPRDQFLNDENLLDWALSKFSGAKIDRDDSVIVYRVAEGEGSYYSLLVTRDPFWQSMYGCHK